MGAGMIQHGETGLRSIGGHLQRFIPADLLPAGIGIAFRPGSLQRMQQAIRAVDQFRRRAAFGA